MPAILHCAVSNPRRNGGPEMSDKEPSRPTWGRFAGIGVEFAGAVAGFTLIGYWVDRHYGWSPWGVLSGAVLGLIGGSYNLVRASLLAARESRKEDDATRRRSQGPK